MENLQEVINAGANGAENSETVQNVGEKLDVSVSLIS